MLMTVVRIKAMCKRAGIAALDGGPKGATIRFHNDKFASPKVLVDFIGAMKGEAKVKDKQDRHPGRLDNGSGTDPGGLWYRSRPCGAAGRGEEGRQGIRHRTWGRASRHLEEDCLTGAPSRRTVTGVGDAAAGA